MKAAAVAPAALVLYLAFRSGGYPPGVTSLAAAMRWTRRVVCVLSSRA